MHDQSLIPHLFRTEYSKIVAVLCKRFGLEHLAEAEDLASESFVAALAHWPYNGIPENPTAWLYAVAKNKARNSQTRRKLFDTKILDAMRLASEVDPTQPIDLSDENIADSQLRMLFAVCHPAIPVQSQIGLALRVLCGFGIDEIAHGFLVTKDAIEKRLFRAREKLRTEHVTLTFPNDAELVLRLDAVLTTLYLLFNEGYYSESDNAIIREDLCFEAMRLTHLLLDHAQTKQPAVHALLALMCFHTSRFKARKSPHGDIVLYEHQDETLWDHDLIATGVKLLHEASGGAHLSRYHIEAGIAYWHTIKADTPDKWDTVLQLYNQLLMTHYSPIAALNRTYALSKVYGAMAAIAEAEKLQLNNNHFYFTLLGELYTTVDRKKARLNFKRAVACATTDTDKQTLHQKISKLQRS